MNEDIRRAIAYAASGRANGKFASSIYSYDSSGYTNMSENYDYGAGAHLGGMKDGDIYHYGQGAHIQLTMNGSQFKGYDYSSGSHFSGRVSGRSVELYDYGSGDYHNYQV